MIQVHKFIIGIDDRRHLLSPLTRRVYPPDTEGLSPLTERDIAINWRPTVNVTHFSLLLTNFLTKLSRGGPWIVEIQNCSNGVHSPSCDTTKGLKKV